MIKAPQLASAFAFTLNCQKTTLHLKDDPPPATRQALVELIQQRSNKKLSRVSAPLKACNELMFVKVQPLDSFKAKVRVTLSRAQRNGRFDWPLEELINTHEAHARGANVSRLLGFGYTKSTLGLTKEFFIITRLLNQYVDGLQWMEQNPQRIEHFIESSFELLSTLNQKAITHMDFWAANVMVSLQEGGQPKAIDLENCFRATSKHPAETLGFQMGFFYRRDVYRFITESRYDELVERHIRGIEHIDRAKFLTVYKASKHEKIGRKERREIFLSGNLITG